MSCGGRFHRPSPDGLHAVGERQCQSGSDLRQARCQREGPARRDVKALVQQNPNLF
ncbi:MAG: hypothetical protein WDN06_14985 [Asticcacaulis sp.]